ncbi:unnamed protein product [Toxocara canis]|uniref:SAFB-like transcription modulator n=1 Tax=Toxocara canis TaxID=6265 RepID=A0A183US38_TOXCA|nr:unnamed protein product [Toxocara canis]
MSETADSSTKAENHGRMVLLSDLRVFELKQELEKRGLDKNGIKLALVERLETALREEGHDPQEFLFSVGDYGKSSTPMKAAVAADAAAATKESNDSKPEEATMVEENCNEDGQGTTEEDHALLIDDGSGEGEKTVIELDDEDGKNDVDTEGEPEGPEPEQEPEAEMDPEPDLEQDAELEPEPVQEVEKASNEQAMEVESVEAQHKQQEKTGTLEKENVGERNAGDEAGKTTKEAKDVGGKVESTEEEEKDKEHSGEDAKKATTKAHIVSSSKTASTIKKTSNSLWIKGLGSETKAADLKALFAKCGRVVTAKIFTRRQQPSSTCFGFVTMVDTAAAEECIRLFNKTHINGHLVTVERADHSSMPAVKSGQKKSTTAATTASSAATKSKEVAKNGEKVAEKKKSESKADKAEKRSEKKPTENVRANSMAKTTARIKKSPVEAPTKTSSEKARSSREASSSRATTHRERSPPVFRKGRRVFERPTLHRTLRGGVASRKPTRIALSTRGSYRGSFAPSRARGGGRGGGRILMSTRGRPLVSSMSRYERGRGGSMHHPPPMGGRLGRSSIYESSYRDMPSRHSGESVSWERREMMSIMRRREEEFRLKEEELKLQRERERIKFERERIERERLELEQLRQVAAMSGSMGSSNASSMMMPPSRRSHGGGYEDMDMSSGRRGDSRVGERTSRHVSAYGRGDRRESSRDDEIRARAHAHRADAERERDRSRHVMREAYDYGSSGVSSGREYERHRRSDSYSRRGETTRGSVSSYGGGHYGGSSRMGGASGSEMSGGWATGSGGMPVGDAYTESSSSRDYGTSQGGWMQSSSSAQMQSAPGGGSSAWRSSQQHSLPFQFFR